ncbi:MAG TPA: hypothetical protein VK943_13520, partial [Arenibaculum sp.]|nr:hypothetical protein [Arenibaculum sp.]
MKEAKPPLSPRREQDKLRRDMMRRLDELYRLSLEHGQAGTALRALTARMRLVDEHLEPVETESELRIRLEAELRPRIEAEIQARIQARI